MSVGGIEPPTFLPKVQDFTIGPQSHVMKGVLYYELVHRKPGLRIFSRIPKIPNLVYISQYVTHSIIVHAGVHGM